MRTCTSSKRVWTIDEVLQKAGSFLQSQGCISGRLDAQVLLAYVFGCDRTRLYIEHARVLSSTQFESYQSLIRRRALHEPVAYLVNKKEFYSVNIYVDPRVIIPRPETETLIQEIRDLFAQKDLGYFADIGTGSGAIACVIAKMFSNAKGVATDRFTHALAVAKTNIRNLRLDDQIELRRGYLLNPLRNEKMDVICANLPYVPSAHIDGLAADIRQFEPRPALDGGADGLALIRKLVAASPQYLNSGGWLVLEVGDGQASMVCDLYTRVGLVQVHTLSDLAGVIRVVAGMQPLDT